MHARGWVGVKAFMCVCLCVCLHINLVWKRVCVCDSACAYVLLCVG